MKLKTKRYHILKFLVLIAWLMHSLSLSAQNYWFKNVGLTDGLSASQVNAICKDSRGFVWLGTSAGLDRFDGSSIRQFQSNYSSASALPDSYILSIQEAYDGKLWIKTNGGYVAFNPVTQTFERSVSQLLSTLDANIDPELVFFDHWKNTWVYDKDNAVYYHKTKQELVYKFRFDDTSSSLRKGNISGICECLEGVLVVYTNGTVCCISGEQQKVLWYNDVIAKNSTQEDEYQVACDINGNIWVYGETHSFFYEKKTGRWMRSIAELAQEWGSNISVGDDLVMGVATDTQENMWVATQRHGLLLMNAGERTIKAQLTASPNRGLTTNNLTTVYVDDTDLLWVGTYHSGACYYAPNLYMFDVDNLGDVYGMSEDTHGGLWFATHDRGLVYQNPSTGKNATYTQTQGLTDNIFSCVLAASDGSVWAGSNRFGLNCITPNGVKSYRSVPGDKTGLRDNNVHALAEDRFGNLWVGTRKGGLQSLNIKTGKFSNFSVQNGKLQSDNVTSLYCNGTQLVAGTANGITLINLSSNKVTNYLGTASGDKHFTSNVITEVFMDSRGIVWVGTREGLNALEVECDQLTSFTTENGLMSNVICGIAEDKNHDIWVTTARGVNRITIQKATTGDANWAYNFYGYDASDGLQGVEFNHGAIMTTRAGRIFMGGQDGINWMHDIKHVERKRPLHVMLSELSIDGQPINVGEEYAGKVILDEAIQSLNTLTLRYRDKDICITLGVDDYNHAEPARFIYQLEGINDAWLPVTGDGHTLKLEYMSSGKYTLHIKAMLDDDKTVSEEHILHIVVQRPWYLQWWVFLVAGIIVLVIIVLIYRVFPAIRNYYRQRRMEVELLRHRQKEIDSVAQDVRSLVVSMIPQLGLLQSESTDAEQKERLSGLHHSARQMLTSLNRLKENKSLMYSDDSSDVIIDTDLGKTADNRANAVDDEALVKTAMESGDILLCDDGILDANGLPVKETAAKYTIYIADVDADMLEFVSDCLKNTFVIRTFTSAEECWQAILDERPSLVMCAENMTDLSGSMLCERIKNERSLERVPFILTTDGVLTQGEFSVKNITLLADDYVPSPYNLQSVVVRVNTLLGEPVADPVAVDDTLRGADAMTESAHVLLCELLDQYIIQNISRKDLSIEEMSRVLGVSRTVLFRKIESITHRSPSDYIRQLRLQEAAKLLESGFLSPAEVAQELGFGNLAMFSRFFQAEYGVMPSQYAESKRGKLQSE